MKWRPSGNRCGYRGEFSPWALSIVVNREGLPPSAETLSSGPSFTELNRITPRELHAAPPPVTTSQIGRGVPPASSTRCSLPPPKKPSDLLSGDQNGRPPSSVPGTSCASRASSERTQIFRPVREP